VRIVVEFEGGFRDGKILRCDSETSSETLAEALRILTMTGNGVVGRLYVSASEHEQLEREKLAREGKSPKEIRSTLAEKGIYANHYYKIVERREENGELYVKLESMMRASG